MFEMYGPLAAFHYQCHPSASIMQRLLNRLFFCRVNARRQPLGRDAVMFLSSIALALANSFDLT
jgi:hypothetical protein